MDYTKAKRIFIFIDESGDSGDVKNPTSSDHFHINALLTADVGLVALEEIIYNLRFYTNNKKELKKLQGRENIDMFDKIFEKIVIHDNIAQLFTLEFDKTKNTFQPQDDIKDFHSFRKTLIGKSIQHIIHSKEVYPEKIPIEIVIDRYLADQASDQNLRNYLNKICKLSPEDAIVQVDSKYCNAIQLLDILQRCKGQLRDGVITNIPYNEYLN